MDGQRVTWDGSRPPNTIYEVWSFLGARLRHVRDRLRAVSEDYYGKDDRVTYLCNVHEALKIVLDHDRSLSTIGNYLELEQLLQIPDSASTKPKLLERAQATLRPFLERIKLVVVMFTEIKLIFEEDILRNLETYCSNYVKLGIADDQFYKSLRSRTAKIRGVLKNFEKISTSLRQCFAVSPEYFTDSDFSQELSIQFNCDTFPILRIVPDLIQKLESVVDTAQDWLRSDKVYLDDIQKELDKTRLRLKEAEGETQLTKFEYDQIFSLVKQKQLEFDDFEENNEVLWKELSKLEARKTRLEIEISAVAKTLRSCRDQLRDLSSRQSWFSEADEADCMAPEEDDDNMSQMSQTHSSYRTRLCRDAHMHNLKLDNLRRKTKHVERQITRKRTILDEVEQNEVEIQKLCKKLKATSRKKSKCQENVASYKSLLEALEHLLKQRLRPNPNCHKAHQQTSKNGIRPFGKHGGTLSRKVSLKGKKTKAKSKKSEELHKAFCVIKNNIGHNWKDLARTLPYSSPKEMSEINNEIRVIEYENQGQLKEQAYQSLLRWYKNCGRRASVDVLSDALRGINEVRLAESIELDTKAPSEQSTPDHVEGEDGQ